MNFITTTQVDAFFDTVTDEFIIFNPDRTEKRIKKDSFNRDYHSMIDNMNFSEALFLLKKGYNIGRKKWEGHEYLVIMHSPKPIHFAEKLIAHESYLAIKTARNTLTPYQPSNSDLMAEDWVIL